MVGPHMLVSEAALQSGPGTHVGACMAQCIRRILDKEAATNSENELVIGQMMFEP